MSALKHFDGQRYELYACVVMQDHVHVLVKPLARLSLCRNWSILGSLSPHINYSGIPAGKTIWQEDYFDRIIRDEQEFLR